MVDFPAPLMFRYSWLNPLPLCIAPFLKDTCVGAADVADRKLVSSGSFCCFNSFLLLVMGILWNPQPPVQIPTYTFLIMRLIKSVLCLFCVPISSRCGWRCRGPGRLCLQFLPASKEDEICYIMCMYPKQHLIYWSDSL